MLSRRTFLRRSASTALVAGAAFHGCQPVGSEDQLPVKNPHSMASLPVIIATWRNEAATAAAMEVLQGGGSALDAVEAGARVPEGDPNDTSVGYGGFPDRDGFVTLDACIMDHLGNAGAVTFLQGIKHPISVARKVMEETQHVMLSGEGALQFALDQGFEVEDLLTEQAKNAWEKWKTENRYDPTTGEHNHDTIGILAIDSEGHIGGACTTSGMAFKMHGRVGDSPILGAGMFVDDVVGGACSTGNGEFVMKTLGSFLIVELMRQGASPQEACEEGIRRIMERYGEAMGSKAQVSYLALNKAGEHGAYSTSQGFTYALYQNQTNQTFDSESYLKG